jgi:hypothetical protein
MAALMYFEYNVQHIREHGFVLAVTADECKKIETLVKINCPSVVVYTIPGMIDNLITPSLKKVVHVTLDVYDAVRDIYNMNKYANIYLKRILKAIEFVDFSFADDIAIKDFSPKDCEWVHSVGHSPSEFRSYDDPLTSLGVKIEKMKLFWHSPVTGEIIPYQPTVEYNEELFSTGGYINEDNKLILTNCNSDLESTIDKEDATRTFDHYNNLHRVDENIFVLVKKRIRSSMDMIVAVPYSEARKAIRDYNNKELVSGILARARGRETSMV